MRWAVASISRSQGFIGGFEMHGPFNSRDAAYAFVKSIRNTDETRSWWVSELCAVKHCSTPAVADENKGDAGK